MNHEERGPPSRLHAPGAWWMACLLMASGALAAAPAADKDLNRQGFAAYEKGEIARAHGLFTKAVTKDPNNAYAWLNLARTTTQLARGAEPSDPCDLEHNWVFLALAHLDRAMLLDATVIGPKIADDTKGLAQLKRREEFVAWQLSLQPLPKDDDGMRALLRKHNFFWAVSGVLQGLTFNANGSATYGVPGSEAPIGTWTVVKGFVEIKDGTRLVRRYRVTVTPWAFGEGKHSFRRLVLEQDGTQDGPDTLEYGPMMDCA